MHTSPQPIGSCLPKNRNMRPGTNYPCPVRFRGVRLAVQAPAPTAPTDTGGHDARRRSGRLPRLPRALNRAGIRDAKVHALRHRFGAHLRMAGVSLADIADLLGHKDLSTTQTYARVQQEHRRSAVGNLTNLVPAPISAAAPHKRATQGIIKPEAPPKLLVGGDLRNPPDQGMAERVGFEPTVRFPVHTLSKRAP